jgi:NADH:ubiquinone oxidoreductase subunit F (NADH-binding)
MTTAQVNSDAAVPDGRQAVRLTLGWYDTAGRASLPEHVRRYGPMPRGLAALRGLHEARGGGAGGPAHGRHLLGTGHRRESLADTVLAAGLTGRGGAGFPTGKKMRTVATGRGRAVVVANGMESEPVSRKDQALLARAPHLVLDGISLAAEAVGADEVHLCLSRTRPELTAGVLAALAERRSAGLDPLPISVHELPHNYVSSEESSLVHWLNGGEAKPTFTPPRPFERGVRKRPTLIDNVETLAHVALIARYGANWFRQAGLAGGAGTMLTTVSGAAEVPGVYEVEAGTRSGDILAMAGADPGSEYVLIGGYFGTWHKIADVADLPFTADGLRPAAAAPGAGIIWVLPPGGCGLAEAARILQFLADQGAQQCGPCMFGLPAIAGDLTQLAASRPEGEPLERLHRRFGQISGRGACRHPDGAVRMAASAMSAFTADAHAHAQRRSCRAAVRGGHPSVVPTEPRPVAEWEWR